MALFLTKSRNFRIFRKKKMWCGFTCFFKKPTPPKSQKNGKNDRFWRGGFFEKTGENTPHFFFSGKSENFAISSKKAPLSEPPNDDSPVRLPRDFGMGPVQENRHPRDLQNAHFFHKNPLFCSIRTGIYVQNGQKPVIFSKNGVGLGGVSLEK